MNNLNKAGLLDYINSPVTTDARNRMGCSENWYDPYYSISHTFEKEEIEAMSEQEVDNLLKLACNISDYLY